MNETSSTPTTQFTKFRIGLCLCLIPILIVWSILILQVPITLSSNKWFSFQVNAKSETATIRTYGPRAFQTEAVDPWSQSLEFDPQTGTLAVQDTETLAAEQMQFTGSRIVPSESGKKDSWQLFTKDKLGETVQKIEFKFPVYPRLLNDRFAVGMDHTAIWTLDLFNKDSELVETPSVSDCVGMYPIENTNLFYRGNFSGTTAVNMPVAFYNLEVFEIDDQAIPSLISSWPVMASLSNPRARPAAFGDQLTSINPKSLEIEYRSLADGSLNETHPLLDDHDPTQQQSNFSRGLFSIEAPTGWQYFDLETRQWFKFPDNSLLISQTSPDDRHWLAYDYAANQENTVVIIEKESKKPGARIKDFYQIGFLNDESLLALSPESGITLRKINVKDGSVTRSWTPLWWVSPLLLISILAFVAWSYAWLRRTGSRAVEVWCSILIMSAIPLWAFVTRTKLVGDPFDLGRSPIQYAEAIVFSLAVLSTIWLINSQQRVVIRLIPMIVSLAVFSAAVTHTFSQNLNFVGLGIIQMAVPVSLFVIVFLVFHRFRYRLLSQNQASTINKTLPHEDTSGQASISDQEKTSLITIQDMFLLVGTLALVFATITPLLPSLKISLGQAGQLLGGIWQFTFGAAIQISAWWLVMTGKKIGPIKISILIVAFLLLLAETVGQFITGSPAIRNWVYQTGLSPEIMRIVLGAFVTTFWLSLAFRFGGWRWERVPQNVLQ